MYEEDDEDGPVVISVTWASNTEDAWYFKLLREVTVQIGV